MSEPLDDSAPDEVAIRSKAYLRSWICPGAGFALVGSGTLAITTFFASLCLLPIIVWLVFQPSRPSFYMTLVMVIIASVLWVVEQITVKKVAIRPPNPQMLVGRFILSSCIMWLAMLVVAGIILTSFGALRMSGTGMQPTLKKGERLAYYKHVDWSRVKYGGILVYRNAGDSAWGKPGWLLVSRILAVPGDKISIANGKYMLNGKSGPQVSSLGKYEAVIDVPLSPATLTVPDDCYFIVQDSPSGGFDSRVLSWVRQDKIIGSRLWYASSRGFFKAVE